MKKKSGVFMVFAVILAALAYMYVPTLAQPGDSTDPLVTRRYVDERIAGLTAEVSRLRSEIALGGGTTNQIITNTDRDQLFADVMLYFETVYGEMLRAAAITGGFETDPNPVAAHGVIPFEPLFVPAGHNLIAEAGVEFILRSGLATAISGPDGMVNVTVGRDVTNGEQLPHNNLMLVPRSDGRGLHFLTDSWLMIKGRYEIVS